MNRLDMAFGFRPMDEAGGEGGGGADAATPSATPTATADAAPAATTQGGDDAAQTPADKTPPSAAAPTDASDLSKVTLGDGKPAEDAAQGEQGDQPPETPLEDYAEKVCIDESIAKDVMVDKGAMMAVAPLLKEAGVSVEMAGKLLNTLAKYQVEQFKERQQERYADNKKMHDAAVAKYSRADFEQINAGIDAAFKPDGVMNYVVRNSEIGNDPEFLELMKWYGQHRPTDAQPATGAATGGTAGQAAGFSGIAGAWS